MEERGKKGEEIKGGKMLATGQQSEGWVRFIHMLFLQLYCRLEKVQHKALEGKEKRLK